MELFKLFGTIAVNNAEANRGIDETTNKAKGASEEVKGLASNSEQTESKMGAAFSKIGSAAVKVGKTIAVGLAAAGTAVVAVGKKAVEAYADYEQLVGGVETLFKDSADAVIANSQKAYQTAGLSANDYMETVTGFSAALLQSLEGDTVEAAKKADMAIIDMSDNANKMGTSIESIQTAYQGFAKQNYTMLDNLKLGYGGTKEEMQRLLEDATALSGIEYDISSYADIVDAIHVVQTEIGITGTTAKEASSTISGSISAAKAAWQNLLVGLADDTQDLDVLIDNFFESIVTVGDNIIPRIGIVLNGITGLIQKLAPKIIQEIPGVLQKILPSVVHGATSLLKAITSVLPQLAKIILDILPDVINAIQSIFEGIVDSLPELLQTITSALPTLIPQIIDAIIEMAVYLMENIDEILEPIIDALPDIVTSIVDALMDNLPSLIDGLISLVLGIVDAIPTIITGLIDALPTIIEKVVAGLNDALPKLVDGAVQLITSLVEHLPEIISGLINAIPQIISAIFDPTDGFLNAENIGKIVNGAIDIILKIVEYLPEIITSLIEAIPTIIQAIFDPNDGFLNSENIGKLVDGAIDVIMAIVTNLPTIIVGLINAIPTIIEAIFDPDTGFLSSDNIGALVDGCIELIKELVLHLPEIIAGLIAAIPDIIESIVDAASGIVEEMYRLGELSAQAYKNGFSMFDPYTLPDGSNINDYVYNGHNGVDDLTSGKYDGWVPAARGGVFESTTHVMLGEAGSEAVVPLENNTGWINRVAQQMKEAELKQSLNAQSIVATTKFESFDENEEGIRNLEDITARILDALLTFFPQLLEAFDVQLVFEDGTIAAELVPRIDRELGMIIKRKERG